MGHRTRNDRTGSKYYKHLNTAKLRYWVNPAAAFRPSKSLPTPRITTAMVGNSGLFRATVRRGRGETSASSDLESVHCSHGLYQWRADSHNVYNNANADFEYIKSIPVFRGG